MARRPPRPAGGGDDIEFDGGGDEAFDLDVTDEAAVDADLLDETEAPPLDDEHALERDLEPLMPPPSEFGAISQGAYDGTPRVVFVNLGGPTIRYCGNFSSDATASRSLAIGQAMKRSSVNFEPYTNAAGRRTILANLRARFRSYHVTFTTTRPAQGPCTMRVSRGITTAWRRSTAATRTAATSRSCSAQAVRPATRAPPRSPRPKPTSWGTRSASPA